MSAECFLDTNVLVYAVDDSETSRGKKRVAMDLIASAEFGLSAQVLQEFYVTVTRKLEKPLAPNQALAFIERFEVFPLVVTDPALVTEGIRNSILYRTSYWDGAILAAADRLGAKKVYSEDLNHGQRYGCTQVVNPFLD